MYPQAHTSNIVERAHAPEIAELLQRFAQHAEGSAGGRYEALEAEVGAEFADDLMTIAPTEDGDYVYLRYGREIARHVGGDRTGERVSRMTPQLARFTKDCYDQALRDGKPAYTVHRSLKTVRVRLWERLVMPATAANGNRFLIVFSRPLEFHEELLTTVLDSSPCGILALRAERDEESNIRRCLVITANRRAAEIAGAADSLLDADAATALPFLADAMVWRRCLYAIELRRSDTFETCFTIGGREVWLQLALAPLADGLVMTLTDISELMIANLTLQSRAATLALEIGRERATRRALSHEIGEREQRERELRRLAETDPLTALLNRRSFIDKAHVEIAASEERGEPCSLIMLDLDHFKSVNDNYGHAAGDAVIRAFADLLLGLARAERDLVGRFGGEEFALFLPRTDAAAALRIAQRIQDALAQKELPASETLSLRVTASLGVATRRADESFAAFCERADRALYRAKREGRDCVRLADDEIAAAA